MKANKLLIIPGALVSLTAVSGFLLSSTITHADGNTSSSDAVSITVDSACTMTGGPTGEGTTNNTYSANINPGSSTEITGSKLVTVCNDSNGYSIYATGYSGNYSDTYNTKLLSTIDHSYDINTAVAPVSPTPSTPSSWAMKLEAVEGLTPPTIETGWDTYHAVPATYTQIAEYSSSTASPSSAGATVQAKYQIYINSTQVADTYTGKVKYTMVHPYDAPEPASYMYIYNANHEDIYFDDLTVSSYSISDRCINSDYPWDITPEQRATYCSGGEITVDEETRSIELDLENDGFKYLYEYGIIDDIKITNVPGATSNYATLNSDVFIKYNKNDFMEQYICTMYKSGDREGEPYCFEPGEEESIEALLPLFGQENCSELYYCDAVDNYGFWYCDWEYCEVSKNSGKYGARINWNSFDFPEPSTPTPDELIYYNGRPLSFQREAFWQKIKISCEYNCADEGELDNRISVDKITDESAYFFIKPYTTNELRIRLQAEIVRDPETDDPRIETSDAVINPESFDYTQFTYHDSPLTSKEKIVEMVENYASPHFRELIGSLDAECVIKIIGEQ